MNTFMTKSSLEPAIFKLPECEGTSGVHLGDSFSTDGTLMTVETCPGQILTIQSSIRLSSADDENSWAAFFLRHAFKIMFTTGMLITGIYQYYKMTQNKKAKAASQAGQDPRIVDKRRATTKP